MAWSDNWEKAKPAQKAHAPSKVRGLVALLVIASVGGMATWFFMRPAETPLPEVREVKKPVAPKPKSAPVKKAAPVKKPVVEDKEATFEDARKKRRELFKAMTPDERVAYIFEEMKKRPIRDEPSSNRIFRTGLEQVMDWVFSCEVGAPPPILPKMSMFDKAHLVEILFLDNPIKETDSERAKDAKETVQLAKKEFLDFIKQGGDPDDFLPYYHGQLVAAHQEWSMARKSVLETLKTDPEITQEYLKKINARLSEKGIRAVQIPPKLLERYGLQPEE